MPIVALALSGCGLVLDLTLDPPPVPVIPAISEMSGTLEHGGPYPAGTSVRLSLEPTWALPPTSDVRVTIEAENGLVSYDDQPGESRQVTIMPEDGRLPDVRVTFPLDPWEYGVTLRWRTEPMPDYVPIAGLEQALEVVEPDVRETEILGGLGEQVMLPRGLVVEEYAQIGGAFDFSISDYANVDLRSIAFPWDESDGTTSMAVSGEAETCFFSVDLVPDCHRTRPETLEEEGPDLVTRVAFYGSQDEARGLYLSAFCGDETSGGGIYRLWPDGSTEQVVGLSNVMSLDVTAWRNRFRPDDPIGLYYFGRGRLRFKDPVAQVENDDVCPSIPLRYPESIAIVDPEVYGGNAIFLTLFDPEEDTASLERLTTSCELATLAGGTTPAQGAPSVRRGPGAVFGHMAHLLTPGAIQLVVPGAEPSSYSLFVLAQAAEGTTIDPVDVARMSESWFEAHPPGLYVLDGDYDTARVLRIYQELD